MNGWLEHDDLRIKPMGWFVRTITFNWPVAITLAPFGIYIKEKYINDVETRKHEQIHWKQQIGMLIIFFYIWYLLEWIVKLFKYGKRAYMNISFERAAYAGDDGRYAWIKYL